MSQSTTRYANANYGTPQSIVRGLLNLVGSKLKEQHTPYKGCYCRDCRLVRKAAKFSGVQITNN